MADPGIRATMISSVGSGIGFRTEPGSSGTEVVMAAMSAPVSSKVLSFTVMVVQRLSEKTACQFADGLGNGFIGPAGNNKLLVEMPGEICMLYSNKKAHSYDI